MDGVLGVESSKTLNPSKSQPKMMCAPQNATQTVSKAKELD